MGHAHQADVRLEVPGDELRAVVGMIRGWAPGKRSLARCRMISTSGSCMRPRISQWTI